MTKQIPAAEVARLAREVACFYQPAANCGALKFKQATIALPDEAWCANCKTRRALLRVCGETE